MEAPFDRLLTIPNFKTKHISSGDEFHAKGQSINKSLVKHDSDITNVNLLRISLKDECESPCKR